ncbi:hypothetical protein GP486_006807 [Trichoglossum hirsutum]|uniref:Uncharacterized protein n=1 Tax=Trichoglossum hirsutum TaxID=265104 RepID=A0A9P8ICX2_9PEZI|nr:hypothetical protein GP486_006807 [Trichoglossum hirsutum]
MEFSSAFKSSQHSIPSPNGAFIATLVPPRLFLRSTSSLEPIRIINVNPDFASRVSFIRWSPRIATESTSTCSSVSPLASRSGYFEGAATTKRRSGIDKTEEEGGSSMRILLADEDTVRVWDVSDAKWTAAVQGVGGGLGKIANVEFGRNADEVLVFSEFGVKLTLWSLVSGRSVEIRDPKFTSKGYGYRPCTSHFALLTRPAAHDVITIHAHTTYRLVNSFSVPTTDAQGLRWSPCGRWIAVWDSASSGYKVLVYTADGHLYRTYAAGQDGKVDGLGVKSLEWSPQGDYLAVGGHDKRITLLSNFTFSPVVFLDHTSTIKLPRVPVWQEQVSASGQRSYITAAQPMCPPTVSSLPTDANPRVGISTIAFNNPDGTLIATRNDSMPTTVWIWSLKLLSPFAVIVQHSPVRSISWHPTVPNLLMIQCNNDQGVVYLWSSTWERPRIVTTPLDRLLGKHDAKWIRPETPRFEVSSPYPGMEDARARQENRPMMMSGDFGSYFIGYVEEEGSESRQPPQKSPYAVTGKEPADYFTKMPLNPRNASNLDGTPSSSGSSSRSPGVATEEVDDTFQYRGRIFVQS